MSRNQSFVRKVIYIAAIALLLLPLSALSQPATVGPKDRPELSSRGGKLSQLRERYNLAQAQLGEIDPASETMKLASLGLRGVAANILWGWAHHYKRVEDWDKVELTVNQIIRLQPNFLKVWDFQSHNLSYNISTEFDDYRMRYVWVKKGIAFLIEGTTYNRNEPGLLSEVGWFVGQKIGRSDERIQFRRMFREDDDFHQLFRENGVEVDQVAAYGPPGTDGQKPDNWLVSRLWYNKASEAVTSFGKPIRGMAPVLFYGRVPMSQINAADAMQRDGYFFEVAQQAWEKAAVEWRTYGDRELPTAGGFSVRMNDREQLVEHIKELRKEIDEVASGLHTKLREGKLAALPAEQRQAFDKPVEQRSVDEKYAADYVAAIIMPSTSEILDGAPREFRPQIRRIVDQIANDERYILEIDRNRNVVAFDYWRTRVQAERTNEARQARNDVYNADKLFAQGEKFEEAKRLYERAWDTWAVLFKQFPQLMDNAEARDLIESISRYRDLLGQLDQPFPADFKLNDLLDMHYDGQQLREQIRLIQGSGAASSTPAEAPKPEEPKPAEPKEPAPKDPAPKADGVKPVTPKPDEAKPAEAKPSDSPAKATESDQPGQAGE
jgi:hypothetical protein